MASSDSSKTVTVARNSFWFGIERALALLGSFLSSVAVARIIGPVQLGYYNYITYFVQTATTFGTMGLPATTRKYMAEHLGMGQPGVARAVYLQTHRLQLLMALAVTLAGLTLVFTISEPEYRWISAILVLGLLPNLLGFIPAQANMAGENMAANVPGAVAGLVLNVGITLFSLWAGWGLFGVACGTLISLFVETSLKEYSVRKWTQHHSPETLNPELKARMRRFAFQSVLQMLLQLIVWGRTDVVLLKWLNPDIRQVTFFSLAYGLAERLLLPVRTFTLSLGATLMVEYGRDRTNLARMVEVGLRYALLAACPLLLGVAAVSQPAVRFIYGSKYEPAIAVFAVATALAVPKALAQPAISLMEASEQQAFLVRWNVICGVINLGVAALLVPKYGALGAALGNGLAQTLASLGIWYKAILLYNLRIPYRSLAAILGSGIGMALAAFTVLAAGSSLSPGLQLAGAIPVGMAVFVILLRLTRSFDSADARRFERLVRLAPSRFRPAARGVLSWLSPSSASLREPAQ